jgi:hypothetical protein
VPLLEARTSCHDQQLAGTCSSLVLVFTPRYIDSSLTFWGFRLFLLSWHQRRTLVPCWEHGMSWYRGWAYHDPTMQLSEESECQSRVRLWESSSPTVMAHLFYVIICFPSHQMIPATEIIAARHVSALCSTQSSVFSRCQCHTIRLY